MDKHLKRLLILVIAAVMLTAPVYAEEEDVNEAAVAGAAVTEAAYTAAENSTKAKGGYYWRINASGENVKVDGGVMATPMGNPAAEPPELAARGAALYSYGLGQIVYGKNENERLEPYSTTKLLTCWLALDNLDPDAVVTVSAKATQAYENGTTIWLKKGEKITIRDLVYGAMLESGNDAAYALGEAVAGSEEGFAELMNQTVYSWGCQDTHFVNANGWKHEEHYTTAHDLAIITAKCLEKEQLREICMTKKYTAKATNLSGAREMKNYLMHVTGNPEGMTGGKTGTWDDDDCAVACSFSQSGLDAVAVVLKDTEDGRPEDVRKLMAFSHEVTPGFIVPADKRTSVKTAWVRHGAKTRTVLATDGITYAYPSENDAENIRTETVYDKLEAPVRKGQEVGKFLVYADDKLIGEHKLLATEDIETGWFPSYVYISNEATLKAIEVIVAFILLFVLVILIARRINMSRKRKKKRGSSQGRGTGSSSGSARTGQTGRSSAGRTVERKAPDSFGRASQDSFARAPERKTPDSYGRASQDSFARAPERRTTDSYGRASQDSFGRTAERRTTDNYGRASQDSFSRAPERRTADSTSRTAERKVQESSDKKESKKETRKRLREKYRDKH